MTTATMQEVQSQLGAMIARLKPGEELVIVERGRPIARLVAEPVSTANARKPGSAAGKLTIVEEDDAHLRDFQEYMP